jgi:hypothetical protein
MEEQIKKLKTKALITVLLSLLAITWQFLSYLNVKKYIPISDFTSMQTIIVYSSYIFLALLFVSLLSLYFTVFRVSLKFKSEKKKAEKEKIKIDTPEKQITE